MDIPDATYRLQFHRGFTLRRVLVLGLVYAWPMVMGWGLLRRWSWGRVLLGIGAYMLVMAVVVMLNSTEQQTWAGVMGWLGSVVVIPMFVALLISASGWLRAPAKAQVSFVITVESSIGMLFWDAVDAHDMLQGPERWSRVMIERGVEGGPDRLLKVYLWNKGKLPVLVDDLAVDVWGASR